MSIKIKISYGKRSKTSQNDTNSHPTTPSYSAELIGSNDDLLNEILLRLPIKSLLKFKSVSKHWLSLISNPDFSRHRSPFPTAASGLFLLTSESTIDNPEFDFLDFDDLSHNRSSSGAPPFKSLNFVNDRSGITIMQSCNGLLLCRNSHARQSKKTYYVYNPTTKHYTTLPRLPFCRGTTVNDVVLAFDPSKSPHYKVVCVMKSNTSNQYQIVIYSSEAGPWRPSSVPSFNDVSYGFNHGVFWNGAIHWLNPWGTSLYFKVDEEQLCQLAIPPSIQDYVDVINSEFRYFGESRDHLLLIDYINKPGVTHLKVFEMEKDYARWVLKFRVDLAEISNVFPDIISVLHQPDIRNYAFSVLSFVRGELFEDSFIVFSIPGKVLRYDFKSKTCYKLCDIENIEFFSEWTKGYQYIESLACV